MSEASGGLFVGLSTLDVIYLVERIPGGDEKVAAIRQVTSAGGPATNAAATFSWLGGRAHLVSGVGRHDVTRIIRSDLADLGIQHTDLSPDRLDPPTVSSIFVTRATGERAIVSMGAETTGAGVLAPSPDWLSSCACTLVDGHEMELSIAVAQMARWAEVPVVLDGGSWKPGMEGLLPYVTHAICSRSFLPPDCADRPSVLQYLRAAGVANRAITGGRDSTLYDSHGSGGTDWSGQIDPPQLTSVIDTTGAGDILHGAFCYYLSVQGQDFPMALRSATQVASRSCTALGTRAWMERDRQ